jgi:radical SAM protein with 4Fe4S-binding SPASM domain
MECPQLIPEASKFAERMAALQQARRIPLTGSLEVTFRCNLRCAHCYVGDFRSGIPAQQEMSTTEIYCFLDEITEAGCLSLLLTGGDPLVRPDFLDIYTYAKQKGLLVTIFTNGTLLTSQIADYLAEWPPFGIEITLYGATAETYERVTGIPGSYARALRGIDLLVERRLPLKLKTMVMSLNQHELDAMRQMAADHGLDFRYDPLLTGSLDSGQNALPLRLTPDQVVESDRGETGRMQEWVKLFQLPKTVAVDPRFLYNCGGGLHSFHVDPYGRLTICMLSRKHGYDLRQGSFRKAWEEFIPSVRAIPAVGEHRCAKCEMLAACGQCPGWAELENGQPQQPVEFLCQVTHLRMAAIQSFKSKQEEII